MINPPFNRLSTILAALTLTAIAHAQPFAIQILDQQTNRGIPLVKLTTTNERVYITDSAGLIAFDEPGLMNQTIHFKIESDGYEFPADGFGIRGKRLTTTPGQKVTIKIKREQIARRLYQITGQGIYRHTSKLGQKPPTSNPNLNAGVMGQDSNLAVTFQNKIYWFWGDTNLPNYPLGNFGTSAATSDLPTAGGLDPAIGINFNYFTNDKNYSRPMFKMDKPGVVWISATCVVTDDQSQPQLVTHYARLKSLGEKLAQGIALYNTKTNMFDKVKSLPLNQKAHIVGHTFNHKVNNQPYIYFSHPFATIRTPATYKAFLDVDKYESFTCIKPAHTLPDEKQINSAKLNPDIINRNSSGQILWQWQKGASQLTPKHEKALIAQKLIKPHEAHMQLIDVDTKQYIELHNGSIQYNTYRKKWIMIANRFGGPNSFLGDVYYAEALTPQGPWQKAILIATHHKYSFYNPVHHPQFDQKDGQIIYFEGTYTNMFSATKTPTPGYNYNQLMYQLDLADPRITNTFTNPQK